MSGLLTAGVPKASEQIGAGAGAGAAKDQLSSGRVLCRGPRSGPEAAK